MLEAAATHLNSVAQVCKFSDLRDQKFRKETETKYFATNMFTVFKEMADKYAYSMHLTQITFKQASCHIPKRSVFNSEVRIPLFNQHSRLF